MNNKRNRTSELVVLAMFSAIIFVLAFTPIGIIDLPLIKATILHVPVIIGSIVLGPKKGAFLGFVFGVTSIIKNTIAPSALSFAFSPLVPVPGMDRGSLWAIVICFVPRMIVGVTPWIVYKLFALAAKRKNTAVKTGGMVAAGIVGSFTNTILVMSLIFAVFKDAFAFLKGIDPDAVLGAIMGIVATNGVPEAIVAAVLVPVVCLPVIKIFKIDQPKAAEKPE